MPHSFEALEAAAEEVAPKMNAQAVEDALFAARTLETPFGPRAIESLQAAEKRLKHDEAIADWQGARKGLDE